MTAPLVPQHGSKIGPSVFTGAIWVVFALAFSLLCFRLYVQVTTFHRLFIDDFLVLFAWSAIFVAHVIWQIEGGVVFELYEIADGIVAITADFVIRFRRFVRFLAILELLFYSAIWAVKFSFITFFRRLCFQVKSLRTWWIIVLCFTICGLIVSVADVDYRCSFGGTDIFINECTTAAHARYENQTIWANAVGDILSDLMILSIPFLILWNARIACREKVILLLTFSVTVIIMIIAIVRVAVGADLYHVDISWMCFWSLLESDAAIMVSCMASLRQLFVKLDVNNSRRRKFRQIPSTSTPRASRKLYIRTQGEPAARNDSPQGEHVLLCPQPQSRTLQPTSTPTQHENLKNVQYLELV